MKLKVMKRLNKTYFINKEHNFILLYTGWLKIVFITIISENAYKIYFEIRKGTNFRCLI